MSKRTLLLADDSVTIQKVVNLTFADEGIDVITVGDGDTAMQKISESVPDVVLADVHMPGLSGYRICEIVRDNPATKDLPVVLLVGSFEPFDEGEAARVGANAYLTKPFQSIRQLVSQVSALMESSPAAAAPEPEAPAPEQAFEETAPEQAFEEAVPAEPVRDTSDIDSLYQHSFTPVTEVEPAPAMADSGSSRYVDVGMDDEMIETTYAGETLEIATEVPQEFSAVAGAGEGSVRAFDSYATEVQQEAIPVQPIQEERHFEEFTDPDSAPETSRPATAEFTLDEMELLELPPISGGQTVEITTPGGEKQVVSLTPELMDRIVEKVVEKMSEKN